MVILWGKKKESLNYLLSKQRFKTLSKTLEVNQQLQGKGLQSTYYVPGIQQLLYRISLQLVHKLPYLTFTDYSHSSPLTLRIPLGANIPDLQLRKTEAPKSRFDRGITSVLWVLAETPALDSSSNHHLLYQLLKSSQMFHCPILTSKSYWTTFNVVLVRFC